MTATPSKTLPLVDGSRIVVPDSLDLITPYVLEEQQDWFEDEIKFLRQLLQPGQKVIDIGANYGVYTLSMARSVGATGQVWAFEPASATADWLARGIAANGFEHVRLDRRALSAAPGVARLTLNDNAELNELVRDDSATGQTEEVRLTTLDACLDEYGWSDIAFLKIDAEGEETNILKGGERFFATLSPLVEFEVKAGAVLHHELVRQFAGLGYQSYRLVPGLQLLAPVEPGQELDDYLLNLFCCKADRAAALAAAGWLAQPGASTEAAVAQAAARPDYQWDRTLATRPYGQPLAAAWRQAMAGPDGALLGRVLALHATSQDRRLPADVRLLALETALQLMRDLCARDASQLRAATLARLAADCGARGIAVQALRAIVQAISQSNSVNPGEPFLPPGERYDALPPGHALGNWIIAGLLEQLERLEAFSSFYTGNASRNRLEILASLGFASPEMTRRLQLLRRRFG